MKNLICTQLESCHENDDGDAVYAYFHTEPTKDDWEAATKSKCAGNVSLIKDEADAWENREEVPTKLSRATNVKRYYLGPAD